MNNDLVRMQKAISNYVGKKISQKNKNAAVQGKFSNGKILIGNKNYFADLAVDMPVKDGDTFWCLISDDKTTAVIVGR